MSLHNRIGFTPKQAERRKDAVSGHIAKAKDAIERCRAAVPDASAYHDELNEALAALGVAEIEAHEVINRRTRGRH